MRATISTEWRNAGMWSHVAAAGQYLDGERSAPCKPWVAEIAGFNLRFGFNRNFITPTIDWSGANRSGNRGVMMYWHVGDGIYETCLGRRLDREFCRVVGGKLSACTREEVEAWLNECSG